MADTKITALTENTAPIATDILPMVDDPSGTALTQKVSVANLFTVREIVAPTITTSIVPTMSDTVALGSSSSMFSDLFLASGAVVNFNNGDVTLTHAADQLTLAGGDLILSAGNTGIAPLKFQSGTNLTTAEAGAMEYDGKVFYASPNTSERNVQTMIQVIRINSAYTMAHGTGLKAMFNSPASGAVTLTGGTYQFRVQGSLSSISATSGTYSFGFLGTAFMPTLRYLCMANKGAVTAVTTVMTNVTSSTGTVTTAATATTTGQFFINGLMEVGANGGTVIPALGFSAESSTIVGVNSYFAIAPLGAQALVSVGNWS